MTDTQRAQLMGLGIVPIEEVLSSIADKLGADKLAPLNSKGFQRALFMSGQVGCSDTYSESISDTLVSALECAPYSYFGHVLI